MDLLWLEQKSLFVLVSSAIPECVSIAVANCCRERKGCKGHGSGSCTRQGSINRVEKGYFQVRLQVCSGNLVAVHARALQYLFALPMSQLGSRRT